MIRRPPGSIVRGLRAISDFEAELQLAHNNRRLAPHLDTVFFMTAVEHGYVSSSLVKEIPGFGGDVSSMGPPAPGRGGAGGPEAGQRARRAGRAAAQPRP